MGTYIHRSKAFAISVITVMLAASCGGDYDTCAEKSDRTPDIFPDYVGVTIPPNIAPLNFEIKDAEHIKASLSIGGKETISVGGDRAIRFPENKWNSILKEAAGKALEIEVSAWTKDNPRGITYKKFHISVSRDSIDPWIAYRLIPPGYELWNRMGIYQRNLEGFEQEAIVTNGVNNGGCVNCHSFQKYSNENWVFHARGDGGGTILTTDNNPRKLAIEKMGPGKSATYPFWHPTGKFIAFSSNNTRQSFYGISRNKIEVYDLDSDMLIYDVVNDKVLADGRFCGSKEWETFPAFSPDGKFLYFCVARLDIPDEERSKLQSHFEKMRYSLVRVPFDENTGTLGEKTDTIYSAWREGGSVSLPRISPDGRFLMYTKADCATFPIQHVEAEIEMTDLTTGKRVDTSVINSDKSDSYHSWSSNGAWVMFSSKRIDGKYTRLFFSHCDKYGKLTKPFLLPQKDPDHNAALLYAYNIPEFIKAKVSLNKEKAARMFK